MTDTAAPLENTRGERSQFAADVVAGLTATRKRLQPKYFYDAAGSELFEQITDLPEYYPTRCEMAILSDRARDIAGLIPPGAALVEFGAGSTKKVRLLLGALPDLSAYVPVDISGEFLAAEAEQLRQDLPDLKVLPVAADFTRDFALPAEVANCPRAGFFPGSTLGNFELPDAQAFMRHAGRMLGRDAVLILGVDLVKSPEILRAAYNDAAGVTARFNMNLLSRINRDLGADFDLSAFRHDAPYNHERARIEMHLVSTRPQTVTIDGHRISFRNGETIHTECSHKYTPERLQALARETGWEPMASWVDGNGYFTVQALRCVAEDAA